MDVPNHTSPGCQPRRSATPRLCVRRNRWLYRNQGRYSGVRGRGMCRSDLDGGVGKWCGPHTPTPYRPLLKGGRGAVSDFLERLVCFPIGIHPDVWCVPWRLWRADDELPTPRQSEEISACKVVAGFAGSQPLSAEYPQPIVAHCKQELPGLWPSIEAEDTLVTGKISREIGVMSLV